MSNKYYKIINFDGSVFTYGKENLDGKTIEELDNTFVEETDLNIFVQGTVQIAEVNVRDKIMQVNRFPEIHPRILWMSKLETGESRLYTNIITKQTDDNVNDNLNDQMAKLFEKFYQHHPSFSLSELEGRLYLTFNPNIYLKNEVNELQKELAKLMKTNDENKIHLVSTMYFDRSEHLDENTQRAYLKFHKILRDFSNFINSKKILVFKDDHRVAFFGRFLTDEKYQEYLNILELLVDYLGKNPLDF